MNELTSLKTALSSAKSFGYTIKNQELISFTLVISWE
jgi:hypothetical protein